MKIVTQKCLESTCLYIFRSKEEKKLLSAIRKSCTTFFIEVVSGLCFGQSSVPEDDLIIMLLDIVFTEQREVEEGGEGEGGRRGTRNLTPFKDDVAADKQPVVRSFLLQLLLEHEYASRRCCMPAVEHTVNIL